MKQELLTDLDNIALSLIKSGKKETADYFLSLKNKIQTVSDNQALQAILKQFMSSGAIMQYADFNSSQEQLFDKAYQAAKSYLDSL